MAQNNNIVGYALMPAGGAQQAPPAGQTYHLPPFTLVGEYSHRRPDRRLINDHKLSMGIPHHPKNKPPPVYVCWRDAVKDQMLARGYISDNWHFPDAEFQQIVAGMRRLKPACDELATASAANNMASMQEIDEAVLQLVKDCGKKLTKTIETNNHVPPPGPGVPPAQVILNPILLPLNAPPQCQWSIATAVPNAGPVVQNAPQANAPGPAQNVPAPPANPQAQNNPPPPGPAIPQAQNNGPGPVIIPAQIQAAPLMGILGTPLGMQHAPPANPQAQNNPPPPGPAIPQAQNNPPGAANPQAQNNPPPAGPANLQAQNNPPPPGPANPRARNVLRLGPKYRHPPANISAINHLALPMFIPGTPVRVQHAPANVQAPNNPAGAADLQAPNNPAGAANLQAPNNPAGAANPQAPNNPAIQVVIPARIQAVPPMGILGTPLGMQDAPPADIPGAAALIVEDPGFEYLGMARRVPRAVSDLSQISEFFRNNSDVFFFNLLT